MTTKIELLANETVSVINAERGMGSPDLVVRLKVAERLITTETGAEAGEFLQRINNTSNNNMPQYKARNLRSLLGLNQEHPDIFKRLIEIQQGINLVKSSVQPEALTEEMKSRFDLLDSIFNDFNTELDTNKNVLESANKVIGIAEKLIASESIPVVTNVASSVSATIAEPTTLIGKTNEMLKPEYCAVIGAVAGTAFTIYNKGRVDVNVIGAGVASVAAGYFGVKYLAENIEMVKTLNPWILKTVSFILGAGMVGGFNKLADAFVPTKVNVVVADTTAAVIEAPVAELAAWY